MRLFVAIRFPDPVLNMLEEELRRLRVQAPEANWSRRENLHLTLEFLGEVKEPAPVIAAMERVKGNPFPLTFTVPGRFSRRGGDILWMGVAPSEPLMELQAQLHRALEEAGYWLEHRPYQPHLTLARRLQDQGARVMPELNLRPVRVKQVSLMRSERVAGRLCYTGTVPETVGGCKWHLIYFCSP